jgi:hypothetical protein
MATDNTTKISLRYLGTSAATAFTIMGALSIVTPDQAQQLVAALHQLNDSIVSGYGALTKMWVILGPVAGVWLTRVGISSGTVQGLIANLLQKAQASPSPEAAAAQKAIVQATSTIAQNKSLPANQDATNTLIAATIALPQVQTIVTDAKTAAASLSPSVVSSDTQSKAS